MLATVDAGKCKGCKTCEKVCPVLAVKVSGKKAKIDPERCRGCGACEQRCPNYAVTMVKRETPLVVRVDVTPGTAEYSQVVQLCRAARLHPEQVICFCTGTRAEEVATAILRGARSPEQISLVTGVRTGCKVECIQPILRLLEAAGVELDPPKGGYQWYGRTVTVWEVPEDVKQKYGSRGFYFNEDIELLDRILSTSEAREGGM